MPSAQFRDLPKHARISVEISIVIDTDGVDRCTRPSCNLKHIVQTAVAGVVPPIAQHDESLSVPRAVFQMLDPYGQRIVQRCKTSRCSSEKRRTYLAQI